MPNWFSSPILPTPQAAPRQSISDELTEPRLNQSPMMARLKGFGAGALEGLRGLTSPAMVAGSLVDDLPVAAGAAMLGRMAPALGRAAEVAPEAVQGLRGAFQFSAPQAAKMEEMYQAARPTFRAAQEAGLFAGDRSVAGLHSLASRAATQPVAETLGEMSGEFTPVGGEALYNLGKSGGQPLADPVLSAYNRILTKGGR